MNSSGLQQNFISFLEKTEKKIKEAPKNLSERLCCEKCRFSTKDTALFERHVAQHEEVTFSCTICNHISYSRVESQRHLVKHKGSFPYTCNWCSYGAVRRDYMVKHIQRIHGESADGIIATKKMEAVKGRCLPAPKTLAGPSHGVKVVSHSAGTVSSLLASAGQTRSSAPHRVTSTTCGLPVIKPQPYIVTSSTHTVCKGPTPNVTAKEAGPTVSKAMEYIKKKGGKTVLENTAVTSALPRVHVGMYGDRSVQQKPPLQSQVVGTTEKAESKTMPKIQVGLPLSNNNHLRTLLSNEHEAPVAPTQKSVISGVAQNIPVAHVLQRSVPSSSNPTITVERFRQGNPSKKHVAQTPRKNKTRPNILLRTPPLPVKSSTQPGGDVGFLAPLKQPNPHNRPLTVSGPEERNPPRSNVQVELLAPLNQPIQHNKPLTVSCPQEITIPAGCLVELVEVKTVNGTRELELRLVPQQLPGPQLRNLNSTHVTSTTNRLSFKCRVTTDGNQPVNTNQEINTSKANAIPEHLVQRSHLKKLLEDVKVNVKNETEEKQNRKNGTKGPGSPSKLVHAVSRSVVSNPSESHKFMQQLCAEQKNVVSEPVTSLSCMHCPVKNSSPPASNKNRTAESLKYKLTSAQPPTNKQEDAELSYQGLPVISSVFSLCPIPQDSLSHFHTTEEDAQISVVSGSKENINNAVNPRVCRPTIKTEDETKLLTDSVQKAAQLAVEKDNILEQPKAPEDTVKENLDTMAEKTYTKDKEDTLLSEICSSSTDALQTDTSTNMNSSPVSKSDKSTQPEITDKRKLETEKSLLTQTGSPLASYMNPRVTLIRMPSLEFSSLSESANKEKRDGEESITARPVVCCMSNQQNLEERTIKLVLKRKRSETTTAQDDEMDLVCIDLPPTNKKNKKEKRWATKSGGLRRAKSFTKNQQLLGKGTMDKMYLMPLKDDQLVKCPGPNQPVVVLNHPNPLVQTVSVEGQTLNNQHCRNSTTGLCNQDGTILFNPVRRCPSIKMTLKKVQGQMYQVTELLLKGVAEKTAL